MRALLISIGSRGDLQPATALGVALRRAGHEVLLLGSPNGAPLAAQHGVPFEALGVNIREWFVQNAQAVVDRPLATTLSMAKTVNASTREHVEAILRHADGTDIIVACGVVNAAATAAEATGLPFRFLAYCSQFLPSAIHAPYIMPQQDLPGWLNRALWAGMEGAMALGAMPALNRERRRHGLPRAWRMSEQVSPRGKVILATSTELSPPPLDFDPDLACAESLYLPPQGELPSALQAFLEDGTPPVYVGFGSITDPASEQTTRLIVEATRAAGVRALISRGWAGLGEGELKVPPSCRVVGALPHELLFPHVAGVVHHGGAGTTTTAARAGRPQFVVPHLLDQFYWARHVRRMGLGPDPIRRRQLSVSDLAAAMRQLVDDTDAAKRAHGLGERERARDGASQVVRHIEGAVEQAAKSRRAAERRTKAEVPRSPPVFPVADALSSMGD